MEWPFPNSRHLLLALFVTDTLTNWAKLPTLFSFKKELITSDRCVEWSFHGNYVRPYIHCLVRDYPWQVLKHSQGEDLVFLKSEQENGWAIMHCDSLITWRRWTLLRQIYLSSPFHWGGTQVTIVIIFVNKGTCCNCCHPVLMIQEDI